MTAKVRTTLRKNATKGFQPTTDGVYLPNELMHGNREIGVFVLEFGAVSIFGRFFLLADL